MSKINIILLAITAAVLAGCTRQTPADLLQAPPYGNEDDALAIAIHQALPPKSLLTLPVQEKGLNAVRKADLDGDGLEEAIVTYKTDVDERRAMVLRQSEGGWSEWLTLEASAYEAFDWVDIGNLDDDKTPELLIGYNSVDSDAFMLDIYKLTNLKLQQPKEEPLKPVATLPYSLAAAGDVDGDGSDEIVAVMQNEPDSDAALDTEPEPTAPAIDVYRFKQNQIVKLAEMGLSDDNAERYYDLKVGKVSPNRNGILLEASTGLHSSSSFVYVWENEGKLKNIYPKTGGPLINAAGTLGSDANGDGILEVGELREVPGQDPETPFVALLYWDDRLQWNGKNGFDVVARSYIDPEYGFSFAMPETWNNQVTVSKPEAVEKGAVNFDMYDAKTGQRSIVFTIYVVPYGERAVTEREWQDNKVRYAKLRTASGLVYAAVYGEPPEGMTAAGLERYQKLQQPAEELNKHFTVIAPN